MERCSSCLEAVGADALDPDGLCFGCSTGDHPDVFGDTRELAKDVVGGAVRKLSRGIGEHPEVVGTKVAWAAFDPSTGKAGRKNEA